MRVCNLVGVLCLLAVTAWPQAKKQPADCGECHEAQAMTQPATQMGQAMQLSGNNQTLKLHPKLTFRRGAYTYTVETANTKTRYTVSDGSRSITVPIMWSMGAQAQTWVLEYDGHMYESLVSYYPSVNGLDVTVGDDRLQPTSLEGDIGRPLDEQGVTTCFGCHATNAIVDGKLNLASFHPGVGCEHCHTGALEHYASMLHGNAATIPPDLDNLSSEKISDFCGRCHRTWELVVKAGWRGPSNVRFQPYRLALSKCFDGSDKRISCIACHDPHVRVVRDVAYYDSKCLACHSAKMSVAPPHAKVCPVSKTHCTSCHMPKTKFPSGHFVFTDHYIRVMKVGEVYPY